MTYQEALKARARLAYNVTGITKRAADEPYDDSKHPSQTPAEIEAAQQKNLEEGKAESNRIKAKRTQDAADEANKQKGIEAANSYAYNRDYQKQLDDNLAAGQAMSNLISTEKATGGSGLNDEDLLVMEAKGTLPPELIPALNAAKARAASRYTAEREGQVTRAQGEQAVRDIAGQKATALARKNLGIGAGAGALAGLGVGAGVYGLAGLFPSLKKRRLLRALIALGAGGAAGTAAGIGTTRALNSRVG